MRLRYLLPILLLAVGALVAPACGSDDGDTASGDSNGTNQSDSGDSGSDEGDTTETTDLADLAEQLPGVADDLGDCFSQAAAFSSLYFEALGGEGGAEAAQQKAEELKDVLPDDLHDDIDVISKAIGQVADEGLLNGSDAMDTPEFNEASDNINAYFEKECGAGG